MFYETHLPEVKGKQVSAQVVLTSSESKRLIAKAVAALPEVKQALQNGLLIIARGTTDAFVVEEVTGEKLEHKSYFTAGYICDGELCTTPRDKLMDVVVLRKGKRDKTLPPAALDEFGEYDVSIKGASAIDAEGNVAVLASGMTAGTIGGILPTAMARHSPLIIAVGLEKLVPSVPKACPSTGIFHFKYSTGMPAALIPIPNGLAVTEIQAFAVLAGVKATMVGAGGIGGSEGSTVLALDGDANQIEKAWALVKSIKGEPPVGRPVGRACPPAADFGYDALKQLSALGAESGFKLPKKT